jgi:hypothetical protein
MVNPAKKILSKMALQEMIFPAGRILIVLLFFVFLTFSLRFIYKTINDTLIIKPSVTQKPFFDIEKFEKIAPQWGISAE